MPSRAPSSPQRSGTQVAVGHHQGQCASPHRKGRTYGPKPTHATINVSKRLAKRPSTYDGRGDSLWSGTDRRRQRAFRRESRRAARDRARRHAGDAGSRDDGCARRREGRTHRGAARLPVRLLHPHPCHPRRQARSCGRRRIATGGSRPSCSNAASDPSRRSWRRWPRCPCRAFRPARSRRSPRNCAATPSRPAPFPPSTSVWTRASTPLPSALLPSLSPTSSSTPVMKRCAGVVMSQAVLIAIGIDRDGRRQIVAVDMANRESRSSWTDVLVGLRRRGLGGVEFVVAFRSRRPSRGRPRGPSRSRRSALLRAFPAQRPRPSAAQGRRRLPAGIALASLSLGRPKAGPEGPPLDQGGPPGPRRLDRQMGGPISQARRLGRGNQRGHPHLLQASPPAP